MTNPNDSAYPEYFTDGYGSRFQGIDGNTEKMWCSNPGGFTKREIVLKDFMCAIITGNSLVGLVEEYHIISERADEFVKVYINQLNKQS